MRFSLKKNKILIVVISAILLIISLNFFQREVKNFFYLISAPIQKWLWREGIGISNFFEGILKAKNLRIENEKLKLKNQELLTENIELKELKKENEILREALNLGLEKEFELKICEIIGKEISQDSLIINKGSRDGIEKDLPVITQQKTLVGKIEKVYQNFSKVKLLTAKESTFDVKILEKDYNPPTTLPSEARAPIFGLAKGKGNLKLILDLIPREKEIVIGDKVFTSAEGGVFPKNLLVGEITEVKKSDVEPFQEIEIKPAIDIKDLEFLFIITNFKKW